MMPRTDLAGERNSGGRLAAYGQLILASTRQERTREPVIASHVNGGQFSRNFT